MQRILFIVLFALGTHTAAAQIDDTLIRIRAPRIALTHVSGVAVLLVIVLTTVQTWMANAKRARRQK
ncbi:MAG TPA: hypothetical protein VES67_00875 [Vicinamibacterales bacterium]|nr:hypothetical protein [Vicinamibacterales bacterium]